MEFAVVAVYGLFMENKQHLKTCKIGNVHIIVGHPYANFTCAYYCWQPLCQFYMCILLLATLMPILHVHIIVGNPYANFTCAYYCWQTLWQFHMCILLLATLMPILHVHIIVGNPYANFTCAYYCWLWQLNYIALKLITWM
jgi:hypothetical protein